MTTHKRRASKPGARRKQKEAVPGVRRQDALAFINDRGKSIKVRLPLAIRMLQGTAAADGRAALESMRKERGITDEQDSRILRALDRAERTTSKKEPPQPDLSGELTIGIMLDEELHARWREAHKDDPEVVWENRLHAVPQLLMEAIGNRAVNEMYRLPPKDRLVRLDQLISRALMKP